MSQYWIYLENSSSDTLILDNNITELSVGGNKRRYDFLDYAGQSGAAVRGSGSYSTKTFIISRVERAENGDFSAWNSSRNDFIKFFTAPPYVNTWLYCMDGENSITLRTKVFCEEIPDDKYKYYRISESKSFKLTSPSGIWENTVATSGNISISGSAEQSGDITNNGLVECPMTITFTPVGNESEFRIKTYEGYGIRFGGNFLSGVQVSYNMKTGKMTLDGAEVNPAQYITAGSPFQIPSGTTRVYVKASGACSFSYSFFERYI